MVKVPARLNKHYIFLQSVCFASKIQRKAIIRHSTKEQVNILCEIFYNIFAGNFKISTIELEKLRKFKRNIYDISRKSNSNQERRALLTKYSKLIPLVVQTVLKAIQNGKGSDHGN